MVLLNFIMLRRRFLLDTFRERQQRLVVTVKGLAFDARNRGLEIPFWVLNLERLS
jgi:hypothetical protein